MNQHQPPPALLTSEVMQPMHMQGDVTLFLITCNMHSEALAASRDCASVRPFSLRLSKTVRLASRTPGACRCCFSANICYSIISLHLLLVGAELHACVSLITGSQVFI